MEKAVHRRPVSEEDEALSSSKKPRLLEASPSSEDIEKYTIFTDSEYKLPFYLAEFALWVFNSEKKASYEKVNVVKTMKSLDVVKGTTYLVTFEASLPKNSNNVKTFQTNIFMSSLIPLDRITKMKIKFVRMKPSGFDYNVEDDSEEKVSESKEDFEEEVSESEEEKSEEEISDESDEEDDEEKCSESDEKDTEEKLAVRKTVGGKGPRQHPKYNEEIKQYSEELFNESDEEDNEEKLCESDEKDTEEMIVVWGRKGPRRHPKYSQEIKKYSEELSDKSVEKNKGKELSESDDRNTEEKPAERKTVGGKGPWAVEKDTKEKLSKSNEEDSKEELSDNSDEEDNEEKLSKSDEKDTDKKLHRSGIRTRGGRKSVGGKAPRIQLAYCGTGRWIYYDPPKRNLSTAALNKLVYLSQLAICVYNMKEVTYYDNVKVLRAMKYGWNMDETYDINFEASLSDGNAINFQTKISLSRPLPHRPLPYHDKIEIHFVGSSQHKF